MIENKSYSTQFWLEEFQQLNNRIFSSMTDYIRGTTLEIWSSRSHFSPFILKKPIPVHLSDPVPENCEALKDKYGGEPNFVSFHTIDITAPDFESRYSRLAGSFRTVVALNVAEHGYLNRKAIQNMEYLLKPQAFLILIVPVYTALYCGLDTNVDEWKVYNLKALNIQLGDQLKILKMRYFVFPVGTEVREKQQLGLSVVVAAERIN